MGFYDGTGPGDVILDDPLGQESPAVYLPMRAASGAEKIARIPPTVNPRRPRTTTRETRSRGAAATADLSLGRDGIRAQYTSKLATRRRHDAIDAGTLRGGGCPRGGPCS